MLEVQSGLDYGQNTLVLEKLRCSVFFLSKYGMSQGLNTTLRNNGIESEGN